MTPIMKSAILLGCLAAAACGETGEAPRATVRTIAPDQLVPDDDDRDDVVITVAYDDGDGDLGGGIAAVHDCRGEHLVTELAIPRIAPDAVVEAGTAISGTLELHVNDVGAIAGPPVLPATCNELGVNTVASGAAVFCVILSDEAGHLGEGDCTHAIEVLAP